MATTQLQHDLSVLDHSTEGLRVERTDISFHNVAVDQVRIEVRVHNESWQPSAPTLLSVEAAPLGAFLPWSPITELAVPRLEPGESAVLRADVLTRPALRLGDFDAVPPQRLLTAVSADDDPERSAPVGGRRQGPFAWIWGRRREAQPGDRDTSDRPLPFDLLDLLGRPNQHWAGNLNVFINSQPVERHMAQSLRIYPGQTNLALFMVGNGHDAYRFDLCGDGVAWEPALFDMTDARSLVSGKSSTPVDESGWLETTATRVVVLAVQPPVECEAGTLEVHVTQRSNHETAVVEFGFDPLAAGPGCYSI